MFEGLGRSVFHHRRLTLVIAGLVISAAAVWGIGVFGALQSSGGFTPPSSPSQTEANVAARAFGRDAADVVILYQGDNHLTDASAAYRSAVTRSLSRLPANRVASVQTYWSTGDPRLATANGRVTYAVVELAGSSDSARIANYEAIRNDFSAPGLTVGVGGQIPTEAAINNQVGSDIGRAEAISLPVLLILLTIMFGSLAAASLPVVIGGIGIIGSFAALRLLTLVTPVSIYSINITTIMGLGLAIDYGLFMVGRFREELSRQPSVEDAVARTVATAGRTVVVSGITVAAALASLLLFPEVFLRSMGYGGVATVLVDMLAAVTVMPALLSVLGHRVNALRVRSAVARGVVSGGRPPAVPRGAVSGGRPPAASRSGVSGGRPPAAPRYAEGTGGWYRLARMVMRRPAVFAAVIVVVLLALGSPFLRITWGSVGPQDLPAGAPPRVVSEQLARDFPGNVAAPIEALAEFGSPIASSPATQHELAAYIGRLGKVTGVTGAELTGVRGDIARIDLRYGSDPLSAAARQIVQHVRDVAPPAGARVYVGGQTAQLVDELASLSATLPWMALVMAAATFVLLFLAFGSVVLPVKAVVMNLLSLSATFGVVVWIFQQGHLSGLLQFTPTGTIDPTVPILMLAIIFGLSTDYEVFLLSRIRERYDLTGDNTEAVASGLQRTGGIITSAALLLVIVVGAFSASGITFIKLLGVGMIVALAIDASIVRVLLVPATMRLLGRANWWAPRPLRRLYARYGIRESDAERPSRQRSAVVQGAVR
jgi:trehalose monomycolate/heme transporter